eukprot:TRINITY_DN23722_c0_g1_i1.p1 TRINITY_DN23722_c0_g1~~TRINITY_DN23722_c0_g1_i1.p1  ORF type:complete len:775 (+),score=281.17 TRINITY_DN23722_c0_g1_i1:33-2327(+)
MSGEGVKLALSSATPAELKAVCKKQAGQIKVLKETLQKTKDELAAKDKKEEENSLKIGALNQCIQDLTKEMDATKERIAEESERKLEIWKTRAKDRITQLESAVREAQQGSGSPRSDGDAVAKLTADMEVWKQRAKDKILQLEASLQEARSKSPTSPENDGGTDLRAQLQALREKSTTSDAALREAEGRIQALTRDLANSSAELETARANLAEAALAAGSASDLQHNLTSLKDELATKEQQVIRLESRAAEAASALDEAKAKITEVKGSEERQKDQNALLEGQLRQLSLKLESLESTTEGGTADFERLEASYKHEIDSLSESLQKARKRVEELEAKVEDLSFFEEMQGKDNSAEVERLEDELRKASTALSLSQNEVTQLKAKAKKIETELKQKCTTLTEEGEAAKSETENALRQLQALKEQGEQQGSETEERMRALTDEFERYKERSRDALTKKTMEVTSLKEVAQTAEDVARELKGNCERLNSLLAEKDNEAATLQTEVDALRAVADGCKEEAKMITSKVEMRFEAEKQALIGQYSSEMEALRETLEARISEAQTMHEREYTEKIQQSQETLDKAREELRIAREQASRASEEKEREVFRASVQVKELKKRIEELEMHAASGSGMPLSAVGRSRSEPVQHVSLGSLELGRDMMLLAQQQANRDWELQQYQEEIENLNKTVKELTQQRDSQLQRLNSLSSETMELESSKNRSKVNMDYLKNILVKFLSEKNKTVQAGLVPVIATMLELSQKERAQIKKEFPSAKV